MNKLYDDSTPVYSTQYAMSSSTEAFDTHDVTVTRSNDVSVINEQSLQLEESRDIPRRNKTVAEGCTTITVLIINGVVITTLCRLLCL